MPSPENRGADSEEDSPADRDRPRSAPAPVLPPSDVVPTAAELGVPDASPELETAILAAHRAGAIIAQYFRDGVEIRGKTSYNLVSDADLDAERAIAAIIRERHPDGHAILGEELHASDPETLAAAERLWIVDPLDGTNNFAHKIPWFAVSVAHAHRGRVVLGVIHHPLTGEWFVAERGRGAWRDGRPVRVSDAVRLDQILVGVGFYYDRGAMMEATLDAIRDLYGRNIQCIRRIGAATLDLVAVGVGMLGAYFEYELSPWDFAAGALFVEEAGGVATDCLGRPLPLASRSSVLAAAPGVHAATLEVVRARMHPDGLWPRPSA